MINIIRLNEWFGIKYVKFADKLDYLDLGYIRIIRDNTK